MGANMLMCDVTVRWESQDPPPLHVVSNLFGQADTMTCANSSRNL
jgi:hypothetical protein